MAYDYEYFIDSDDDGHTPPKKRQKVQRFDTIQALLKAPIPKQIEWTTANGRKVVTKAAPITEVELGAQIDILNPASYLTITAEDLPITVAGVKRKIIAEARKAAKASTIHSLYEEVQSSFCKHIQTRIGQAQFHAEKCFVEGHGWKVTANYTLYSCRPTDQKYIDYEVVKREFTMDDYPLSGVVETQEAMRQEVIRWANEREGPAFKATQVSSKKTEELIASLTKPAEFFSADDEEEKFRAGADSETDKAGERLDSTKNPFKLHETMKTGLYQHCDEPVKMGMWAKIKASLRAVLARMMEALA